MNYILSSMILINCNFFIASRSRRHTPPAHGTTPSLHTRYPWGWLCVLLTTTCWPLPNGWLLAFEQELNPLTHSLGSDIGQSDLSSALWPWPNQTYTSLWQNSSQIIFPGFFSISFLPSLFLILWWITNLRPLGLSPLRTSLIALELGFPQIFKPFPFAQLPLRYFLFQLSPQRKCRSQNLLYQWPNLCSSLFFTVSWCI